VECSAAGDSDRQRPPGGRDRGQCGEHSGQTRQPSLERVSFAEIALLYTGYRAWSRPYTGYGGVARFSRFFHKKVRTGPSARLPSFFVHSVPSYFVSDLGAIVVHRHRHWLNKAPCLPTQYKQAPVADMPEKPTPGSQRCGDLIPSICSSCSSRACVGPFGCPHSMMGIGL
jgi:hypothetical protein